jgi:hypothetical protein
MTGMASLHTDLRGLLSRHRHSETPEVQDLLRELDLILDLTPAPAYQYRNHPKWDTTWMDLDESQIDTVLKMGHTVERRLLLGDWEPVAPESAHVSG